MAGIIGIFQRDGAPADLSAVRRMSDALRHRGPDGDAFLSFPKNGNRKSGRNTIPAVILGHRRLAVGTSEGHGLSESETGETGVAFDGRLDNGRELRRRLTADDRRFRGGSDAEVVAYLYEQGREDWLTALDGVFAFALWDVRRRRLLLVRDRLGGKPLYYAEGPGFVAFGSEVKALIAASLVPAEINPQALAECFTFQNTYGAATLFDGIRIVRPGTTVTVDESQLAERRWFELQIPRDGLATGDLDECARELRYLLEESVAEQVEGVEDTPVGVFLSGGIDSGAITAFASRHLRHLHTFTCGFEMSEVDPDDAGVDERSQAERIADLYGTRHHSRAIGPETLASVLPRLIHCQEELRLGMTYQNFHAAEFAGRFVPITLGGIGGDELFSGYPWRNGPAAKCRSRAEFDRFCLATYQRLVPESDWDALFSSTMRRRIGEFSARDALMEVFSSTDPEDDFLHRAILFEMRTGLHAQLVLEDKIQMAFSTDYRTPLLSNRLVEFALSIPAKWKLGEDNGKLVFRRALEGLLPGNVLAAKKQGFCPPDRSWFRRNSMPWIREFLFSKQARERDVFNRKFVERILEEHTRGVADHRLLIWSFLCFEWWCRLWIDREPCEIDAVVGEERHFL